MMYIHLHNLRFSGFHGLYEEEKLIGNDYEVNVDVGFDPQVIPVTDMKHSIDYTALYHLVKKRMAAPTGLLETIVTGISEEIRSAYPQVSRISISLKKLYPPVNNFEGAVGVSFEWHK